MSSNAVATDRKAVMRDKRAQGIAAMGLVTRENDRFRVLTPTLRGRKQSYEVWRDEMGKVRCSCLEFEEQVTTDSSFRCEHILAVKHSLLARNTEAVTKQQPAERKAEEVKASLESAVEAAEPNTNANASEEQETKRARKPALVERSERETSEAEEAVQIAEEQKRASNVRSLAEHNEIEEQEMSRKKDTALEVQEITNEGQETVASVVPFTNTLRALKQQVDPNFIKTREGWTDRQGNTHMVEYVEWHTVADILDRIAPTWQHAVRNVVQLGDIAVVTAAITIDGVTREGVGTGTSESEMGIKKAEHDALKRAAVKFGIARELYQRETEVIERQGAAAQPGQMPRDPLAKSMADLVTPKQLGMIRALAREAGVDPEEECQSVLRCKTDELSKRAASSFIDHLKGLQQEAGTIRRAS
ncbi:MAG TPA: Rad52/Rad22 family DNA repair protein [Pyrinomonadaceae bacterium]|nr:Rad52/Rad22 family DNA repair protein [Pyrinomonadaceae bacterium]